MARAPTKKSRMIASASLLLVAAGLVLDGWFSPPIPPVNTPLFGFAAIALMQIAKQTREAEGQEIPDSVLKNGAWIANTEVLLAAICGLGVSLTLGMVVLGASKPLQQVATIGTLSVFAATAVVFQFTRARFDALMSAATTTAGGV